ncbi:MAG: aldo/keto reductase, partial [Psychromonas sp.]|nr:aldo/keto reductase [Psychromonas sp.]
NRILYRPTVSSVLIGARNELQLRDNIHALGWRLTEDQVKRLDQVSQTTIPYPYYSYWNGQFSERNLLTC